MDFNQHIALCGCPFLTLRTWAWIPQHLWSSPLISRHGVGCPAARSRCENRRGGFQFPFIRIWTRRAVLSRRGATPAETWQLAQTDHATLDLVAATMHSSSLEVGDFVPAHLERLSRRLSFGMDGISMDYLFNQWRMWRLGSPIWANRRAELLCRRRTFPAIRAWGSGS